MRFINGVVTRSFSIAFLIMLVKSYQQQSWIGVCYAIFMCSWFWQIASCEAVEEVITQMERKNRLLVVNTEKAGYTEDDA